MERTDKDDLPLLTKPEEWRRGPMIGKGKFGLVHMAVPTDPRSPRFRNFPPIMAVKSSHVSNKAHLENEKLLLSKLTDCPHIIRYLGEEETMDEDGRTSLNVFLEFASGGTLASLRFPLDESLVRRHTRSILSGIKRIHDDGYVHCDLKLENILLVDNGGLTAKIADFGMAKSEENRDSVRGTAIYMAPESAMFGVQEQASDLWALGCIVLEMFGVKLPWVGRNFDRGVILRKIMLVDPVLPEGLSEDAANFIRRCFQREPWDRTTAAKLLMHPFVREEEEVEREDNGNEHHVAGASCEEKTPVAFLGKAIGCWPT